MKMKLRCICYAVVVALALMALVGCSDGSSGKSRNNSNWDEMTWDQDNWG